MGSREEFERALQLYASRHVTGSGSMGLIRKIASHFYDLRQSEIDAKDKVIDDLALQKAILKAHRDRIMEENAALKAEVLYLSETFEQFKSEFVKVSKENPALKAEAKRLRADAKRYRYLRDRNLETIDKGGIFAGIVPENAVINGIDLDQHIDAALKETK